MSHPISNNTRKSYSLLNHLIPPTAIGGFLALALITAWIAMTLECTEATRTQKPVGRTTPVEQTTVHTPSKKTTTTETLEKNTRVDPR